MKFTRLAAPVAVAATMLAGAAAADAGTAPSYVKQIDTICASVPSTPNLTLAINATNISHLERAISVFSGLIKPLGGVSVPQSTPGGKAVLAWATDVGKVDGYLNVGLKYAKAGNTKAFDAYMEKAYAVVKSAERASHAAGLTGC